MNGSDPTPSQQGAQVDPNAGTLQQMNQSAQQNAASSEGGVQPCPKKSWFAIRIVTEKDEVIEGLKLKLKLTAVGETERVTSKAADPVKIDLLDPGGKGDVLTIEADEIVWEAVGDIT